MQVHLWDDNKMVVEWLLSQLNTSSGDSALEENIKTLQKDAISHRVTITLHVATVLDQFLRSVNEILPKITSL